MAVVYADLRFTRAPRQDTGVTREQEDENWDITYENVTTPNPRDETQPSRPCLRDSQTLRQCVTITLILLSCSLMAVVFGLAVRLSQVSELQLSTEAELQQLQGKHEELGSTAIQANLRKDSMIETLEENLRQSQQKLEKTLSSLHQEQNKQRTTTQEMERTIREKENTETTLRILQANLLSTKTQLEGKQDELSRCEYDLRLMNNQKKTSETSLTQTTRTLQTTQEKLRAKESALIFKDKELSSIKKLLQEAQKNLEYKERYSKEKEKSLTDLEQRLNDAGKCLTRPARNPSDTIEYCPPGWHQIGELCYYLSTEKTWRSAALDDCEKRSATLAKVEDEHFPLAELIRSNGASYWIGLSKNNGSWEWMDGTIKEDFQVQGFSMCVKASPQLSQDVCRQQLPWICEMRTKTYNSQTEALRCIGEKMGLFGENHQEQ